MLHIWVFLLYEFQVFMKKFFFVQYWWDLRSTLKNFTVLALKRIWMNWILLLIIYFEKAYFNEASMTDGNERRKTTLSHEIEYRFDRGFSDLLLNINCGQIHLIMKLTTMNVPIWTQMVHVFIWLFIFRFLVNLLCWKFSVDWKWSSLKANSSMCYRFLLRDGFLLIWWL